MARPSTAADERAAMDRVGRIGADPQEWLAVAAVLAAGCALAWGLLLRDGVPWGHDASFHAHLADGMARGLADGHLYPRWISEANRGYGSPALFFYSPGSSYAVALLSFVADGVPDAMRWAAILSAIASGLVFYFCARDGARPAPAAAGAVLYVLLPYHALDLYERFAFAEYNAFVWLPLLFYGLRRLAKAEFGSLSWRRSCVGVALALAALILTHLLVAVMALFIVAPFVLGVSTARRRTLLAGVVVAGLGAAMLAAVYLVPLLAERSYAHTDHLLSIASGPWERNFAFRDEEAFGYGRSAIKPLAEWCLLAQLAVTAAAAPFLLGSCKREGRLLALLSVIAVVLQLPVSAPLWRLLSFPMATIVYPWRFQVLQILCTALLAVWVLERRSTPLAWGAVAVASLPALLYTATLSQRPTETLDLESFQTRRIDRHVQLEHMPAGVPNWWRFAERRYRTMESRIRADGPIEAEVEAWSSHRRRVRIEAPEARTVVLRTFAYPGWSASLNGEPVALWGDPVWGAISVEVAAGVHTLEVTFEPGWDRRVGALISLGALLLATGAALVGPRTR